MTGCAVVLLTVIVLVPLVYLLAKFIAALIKTPSKLPMEITVAKSSELKSLVEIIPAGKLNQNFNFKDASTGKRIGERCDLRIQDRELNVNLLIQEIPFNVTYQLKHGPSSQHLLIPNTVEVSQILEIRIPITQKFWFRMNLQGIHEKNETEIHAGVDWLDRKYLIHTNQRQAGEQFLHEMCNKLHFSDWRFSFDKLEIIEGEICLILNQPGRFGMNESDMNFILEELLLLAAEYERSDIVILHSIVTENSSCCPYCRSLFDEHLPSIVFCAKCSTQLHESCWKENGVCTTWGCGSVVANRDPAIDATSTPQPFQEIDGIKEI